MAVPLGVPCAAGGPPARERVITVPVRRRRYTDGDAPQYLDIVDGNAQITGNARRWAVSVVG